MSEKINVLFMRDDSPKVRRFRVSPFWLKLLVWSQILLVTVAAAGIYAGYTFWHKNDALITERVNLQRELREYQVHLERLENMEQILQSNDPEELQTLFGNMSIEESTKTRQPIDLSSILDRTDTELVSISNISLKAGSSSMRLTFDLNNQDAKKAVSGDTRLAYITRDGLEIDIPTGNVDMSFQISRFKKMVANFRQPEAINMQDVYALRITIISDNERILLREIYPLDQILQG